MKKLQLRYNDDALLRTACPKVTRVDSHVRELLEQMMDTLIRTPGGAALAANQVGILLRLVVVDYAGYHLKLANPEIVESAGEQECMESCLSFPGQHIRTRRPKTVTLTALDENNETVRLTVKGEMAKCLCHEIDHLDGIVFTDKRLKP